MARENLPVRFIISKSRQTRGHEFGRRTLLRNHGSRTSQRPEILSAITSPNGLDLLPLRISLSR